MVATLRCKERNLREITHLGSFSSVSNAILVLGGFIKIDNYLEEFHDADMSFLSIGVMKITYASVNIDTREGLVEELEIVRPNYSHIHIFNYEGIHFQCRRW